MTPDTGALALASYKSDAEIGVQDTVILFRVGDATFMPRVLARDDQAVVAEGKTSGGCGACADASAGEAGRGVPTVEGAHVGKVLKRMGSGRKAKLRNPGCALCAVAVAVAVAAGTELVPSCL